jgi:hypothetical protein
MDLTDVLREASIIDHNWYGQGMLKPGEPTFDPVEKGVKKHNNTKPELEVEWGNAGPNIDIDEPAGVVPRNIPEENLADASKVIMFARDQMNRGRMGKALVAALKAKFDQKTLKAASPELRKQLALEGIVGCIAVDGRGYRSCQEALKAASHSPYKRSIRYVVGCQCGDPHFIPSGAGMSVGTIAHSTGNAVDDFLASDAPKKTALVSHCRSTMMPILSWRGDLDQSELDGTMIDIHNMTGLPEGQYKQIWQDRKNEKISSNLEAVREVFRQANALKEKIESGRYAGTVDNSEFRVNRADNEIEFGATPMGDLDVDPTDYGLQQEIQPDEPAPTNFDGPPSLFSELSELDLAGQPDQSQIPVEMTDEENESELLFDDVEAPQGQLPVEPQAAPMDAEFPLFEGLSVEMDQFKEPEFEGVGDIDLDDEDEDEGELDVNMRPDMEV